MFKKKRCTQGERAEHASSLVSRVEELICEAKDLCAKAKADKKYAAASNALNSIGRSLELIGKLTGEIATPNAGGIHVSLTSNRTTVINSQGSDEEELAELIGEATRGFSIEEFLRLRDLVCRGTLGKEPDVSRKLVTNQ